MNQRLRISVFTLISLILNTTFAQEQERAIGSKHLQLGLVFSPDICFRTLKTTDNNQTYTDIVRTRNESETVKFGYTAGMNACFAINSLLGLEMGLHYSNKGYQSKPFPIIMTNGVQAGEGRIVDQFHYIDIPLSINFTVGKGRIRFLASAGIVTNLLVEANQIHHWTTNGNTEKYTVQLPKYFNKLNLSPTISAGIDYKINERMHLRIEPTARYGLINIFSEPPITSKLYTAGIAVGYYCGF